MKSHLVTSESAVLPYPAWMPTFPLILCERPLQRAALALLSAFPERRLALSWLSILWLFGLGAASAQAQEAAAVSYGRDIRPLLSDRCFLCHGPDVSTRQAKLRLDTFEFATAGRRGGPAIVPGDPGASALMARISSSDPDDLMPPAESHRKALNAEQQALFSRWIEDGAHYEEHWAYRAAERPEPPGAEPHPIDAFLRFEMRRQGLQPAAQVEPELALRRLFLDLTGLPPTLEELDAFASDRETGTEDEVWRAWIQKIFAEEPYRSRYAERMASPWMDQARYADTSGIHMDAGRQIWPWRDWVLEAYRNNMPFDRFLTEQLAGDLLPQATVEQRVASGFNRNHVTTDEGGAIDAEYLVEYAADRVETTTSVFLGLTMACARCHDHKFDPLTQEDYYSLFAFFASNEEPGLYTQRPNPNRAFEPFIEVPSEQDLSEREALTAELEAARAELAEPSEEDRLALAAFRRELPASLGLQWAQAEIFEAESQGGATLVVQEDGSVLATGENPEKDVHRLHLRTDAMGLQLLQLDVLGHESFTNGAPGRAANGNAVLTGVEVQAISLQDPDQRQDLAVRWLWADAAQTNDDWSLYRAFDERHNTGWAIAGHTEGDDRMALFLVDQPFGFEGGTEFVLTLKYESIYANHAFGRVRVKLASLGAEGLAALPLAQGPWYHAGPFTLEEAGSAYEQSFGPATQEELDLGADFDSPQGAKVRWQFKPEFQDDELVSLPGGVNVHYVGREIYSSEARTVQVSLGSDDGFALFVNGEQVANRELPRGVAKDQDQASFELRPGRNSLVLEITNTGGAAGFYYRVMQAQERLGEDLVTALVDASLRRDQGAGFDESVAHAWRLLRSPEYAAGLARIEEYEAQSAALEARIPRTMVMREREEARMTYVLNRGQYDQPDKERPVTPDIPRAFGSLLGPESAADGPRATRLDLANWMTARENPLVSRVAVNRLWQLIFGQGLVRTSGDFGYQGAWPSHPELLDWLAVEFMESGWDVQALLATIMTSETYRQSSHVSEEMGELDPENLLLARYPRRRLDAEMLRDQALYTSGLLVERVGGPSVKPYHPEGLWREVAMLQSNTRSYERGMGDDLWRRSLYTYWKRACPPPSMMTFDAPTREACVIQRSITNTPLQALVLWNDEQFVEAARVLAERSLLEALPEATETDELKADEARLVRLFRRCTGRRPTPREVELLSSALASHRERYGDASEDASALLEVGERPASEELEVGELAAWTLLASTLLNLHATITQG